MTILDTKYKRKSAVITACILVLLIFGVLNFGMLYVDPPEEYGLAISFGNADLSSEASEVNSKKTASKKVVKKTAVAAKAQETSKEISNAEIIANDTSKELPMVPKIKEEKKTAGVKEVVEKETPKETLKEISKETLKPTPSKANQDALDKLLSGTSSEGKGDGSVAAVKGKNEGRQISSKYYGNTGSGLEGNYNLAGRKVLSKPKEQPDCQEEGTVVVRITVAKNGKVVTAVPGVKGTTNTAACLLKPAKEAALKTVWNVDVAAPKIQTGTIIYTFSLIK
jgi:protein TonB